MNSAQQEVLKPIKGPSMFDLIVAIADKGQGIFDHNDANYIRNVISGKVKFSHPDRKYKTEKEGDILIVKRNDDGFDD